MTHSSAVGFFAFALFLFACVSASGVAKSVEGEAPAHIVEVARQTVEAAKKSTNEVIKKRQEELNRANSLLGKVKSFGTKAQNTQSKAERAAEGYETAKEIVQSIKGIYTAVNNLQISATDELQKTISSLGELLKEAETLKGECDTEIKHIHHAAEDYIDTSNKVPNIKRRAGVLENTIADIFSKINGVQSTADDMERSAEEAQLKNFHVSVIVAVAKIETMIKEAEGKIKETQNHKGAVNDIVNEMMNHCKKDIIESNEILKTQCQSSDDALTSATGVVTQALKAEADIKQQKGLADTALANIAKTETNLIQAEAEATAAKTCVRTAGQHVVQLNNALETAKESVTKANNAKQGIKKALSTTTTAPNTVQSTETAKTNSPVVQEREAHQKDTTIQPTISVPLLVALIASAFLQ